MPKVGQRIKELREKRKMTQKKLASYVNASPQKVSNWEREYTSPDHDDIARLAVVLETSADYLLFGTETKKSSTNAKTNDHLLVDFESFIQMLKSLPEDKQKEFYQMSKTYVAGLKSEEK